MRRRPHGGDAGAHGRPQGSRRDAGDPITQSRSGAEVRPEEDRNDGSPAGVELVAGHDHHLWTLADWPIVGIAFDRGGARLSVRTMEGSAEVRIGGRIRLRHGGGEAVLDAAETETLAPLLSLLDRPLRRVRVGADGVLALTVGDATIEVRPDPRFEAWDAQGAGVLDGLSYRCRPGGGPPWPEG